MPGRGFSRTSCASFIKRRMAALDKGVSFDAISQSANQKYHKREVIVLAVHLEGPAQDGGHGRDDSRSCTAGVAVAIPVLPVGLPGIWERERRCQEVGPPPLHCNQNHSSTARPWQGCVDHVRYTRLPRTSLHAGLAGKKMPKKQFKNLPEGGRADSDRVGCGHCGVRSDHQCETSQADPTHFPTSTAEQLYRCRSCERRRLEALTISAAGLRNYRSKGCSAAARPNLPRKKNI